MVVMRHSTFPFSYVQYCIVATALLSSSIQVVWRILEMHCGTLSVMTVYGISKLAAQYSIKILIILVAVFLEVRLVLASLV